MNARIFFLLGFALLATAPATAAEESPAIFPREIVTACNGRPLRVTLALFSPRQFSLRVIDNAAAHDTGKYARLALAMPALGGAAGCNGGFFNQHPFDPVGFLVADGVRIGAFDAQSWMQGLIVVRDGELNLEVAKSFQDAPAVTQLLQTGPWLVRRGMAEPPGDARVARRTFICRDDTGRWALGASERCTLDELAAVLKGEDVSAILAVQDALNLDGGPSTGLWIKGDGADYSLPEKWTVRDYIGIFPREPMSPRP